LSSNISSLPALIADSGYKSESIAFASSPEVAVKSALKGFSYEPNLVSVVGEVILGIIPGIDLRAGITGAELDLYG